MPFSVFGGLRGSRLFWRFFRYYLSLVLVLSVGVALIGGIVAGQLVRNEVERVQSVTINRMADRLDADMYSLKSKVLTLVHSGASEQFAEALAGSEPSPIVHDYPSYESYTELSQLLGVLFLRETLLHSFYVHFPDHDIVVSGSSAFRAEHFFRYENRLTDEQVLSELADQPFSFTAARTIEQVDFATGAVRSQREIVSMVTGYPLFSKQPQYYVVLNIDAERLAARVANEPSGVIAAAIVDDAGSVIMTNGDMESVAGTSLPAPDGDYEPAPQGRLLSRTILYQVPSAVTPWHYLAWVDFRSVTRTVLSATFALSGVLGLLLVAGWILSAVLSRRISAPIQHITTSLAESLHTRAVEARGDILSAAEKLATKIVTRHAELQREVEEGAPLISEMLLIRLLRGRLHGDQSVVRELFAGLQAESSKKQVILISLRPRHEAWSKLSARERQMAVAEIRARAKRAVSTAILADAEVRRDQLAMVVRAQRTTQLMDRSLIQPLHYALVSYEPVFGCTVCLGPPVDAVEKLVDSYETAVSLVPRRRLGEELAVFRYWEEDDSGTAEMFLSPEEMERVENVLTSGTAEQLEETVEEIVRGHVDEATRASDAVELAHDLMNTILRSSGHRPGSDLMLAKHPAYVRRVNAITTLDDLEECLSDLCREASSVIGPQPQNKVFEEIEEHIQREYRSHELSLEYFAARTGMSMGHFSRCFQRHTGRKFVDYLNSVRIEQAKELLADAGLRVGDIAREVGFGTATSFIAIFKRYLGVTPGQYRTRKPQSLPR